MAEVLPACNQLPLLPYQVPSVKLEKQDELMDWYSFGDDYCTDNLTLDAALLNSDFNLDFAALDDSEYTDDFWFDGIIPSSEDIGRPSGIPASLSSCSLNSNCSSESTLAEEDFLINVPTGARSRRDSSTARHCTRPISAAATPVAASCWPVVEAPALDAMTRQQRVQRYREKRKRRTFEKTIRYEARRAYAEARPRIKGRFATKEEAAAIRAARPTGGSDVHEA